MDQANKWLDLSGKVVIVTGGSMGLGEKWSKTSLQMAQMSFMPIWLPTRALMRWKALPL